MLESPKFTDEELKVLSLIKGELERLRNLGTPICIIRISKQKIIKAYGSPMTFDVSKVYNLSFKFISWTGIKVNKNENDQMDGFCLFRGCEQIVWYPKESYCEFFVSRGLYEFLEYCLGKIMENATQEAV